MKRFFEVMWNAVFTTQGRANVSNRWRLFLAGRSPEWRRGDPMPFRMKNGRRFVAHRGNALSNLIYAHGAYEPLESELAAAILRPGDTFIDIGANIGYFTALGSEAVGQTGVVHAFEPGRATFMALSKTISALGLQNVTARNAAVAESAGMVEFWVSDSGRDAQQGMLRTGELRGDCHSVGVEAVQLDDYAGDWNFERRSTLRLVKCDVEGAEVRVLRGAGGMLAGDSAPVWLIEHNRAALREHGFSSDDLCGFFRSHVVFYIPLAWPPSIRSVDRARPMPGAALLPGECNLLAIPKKGAHSECLAQLRSAGLLALE
jgi:FkbM family methyltransferase